MTKVTKTAQVIAIMTENANKSMDEVCALIEAGIGAKNARAWYRWVVDRNLAPGKVERKARGRQATTKAPTAKERTAKRMAAEAVGAKPKAPKAKAEKAKKEAPAGEPSNLAEIKAKNLARLKDVAARTQKGRFFDGAKGVPAGFDADEARAEVAEELASLDSFTPPKFLTKNSIKALV